MMFGSIVVIKRSGSDGSVFSLLQETCILGRDEDCDIRIQLLEVSGKHARLDVDPLSQRVYLTSLGGNGVQVGSKLLPPGEKVALEDKDLIQISERFFRFEYPSGESRKRVSFGPAISPEYIDHSLPPSTPVKKGANPDGSTSGTHALKRRITQRIAATPSRRHGTIVESESEMTSPVGVLVRHPNDTPRVKASSGSRTSPRSGDKMPESSLETSQFYGASAAQTPEGAKKPLSKTPRTKTPSRKASPKTPRPKKLLTKNPSQFYGASAAKTPKGAKNPLPKTPKNTVPKTPKNTVPKTPKNRVGKTPRKVSTKLHKVSEMPSVKKSWADMLKKNLGKTPKVTKLARESQLAKERQIARLAYVKKSKKATGPRKVFVEELPKDRHAQSPEDIVIRRSEKSPKRNSSSLKTNLEAGSMSSPRSSSALNCQSVSPKKVAVKSGIRRQSKSALTRVTNESRISRSSPLASTIQIAGHEVVRPQIKKRFSLVCSSSPPKKMSVSKNLEQDNKSRSPSTPASTKRVRRLSKLKLESFSLKKSRSSSLSSLKSPITKLRRFSSIGSINSSDTTPRSVDISTTKQRRLSKHPSSAKQAGSPTKKMRNSSLSPSKTPKTKMMRSSSSGSISTLKIGAKTPSTAKRGRASKAQSSAKKNSSPSKKSRNLSMSPSKTPKTLITTPRSEATTPSTTRKGRTAQSSTKQAGSSTKKMRNSSLSPSKTPKTKVIRSLSTGSISSLESGSKTPSSAKRGRQSNAQSTATENCSPMKKMRNTFSSPSKKPISKVMRSSSTGSVSTSRAETKTTPSTAKRGRPSKAQSAAKVIGSSSKKLRNLSLSPSKISKSYTTTFSSCDSSVEHEVSPMNESKTSTFNIRGKHQKTSSMDSSLDGGIMFSASKTPANSPSNGRYPLIMGRSLAKSLRDSLGSLQDSSFFDFDSVQTPKIPLQVLVSPLLMESNEGSLRTKPAQRMSLNTDTKNYNDISQRKRHSIGRIDINGRRSAHFSPEKRSTSNRSSQIDRRPSRHVQKSPKSSYENLIGVKELLKTPKKLVDNLQDGDLEALFASPEYKLLTQEKRNSFLKKLQAATKQSLNRKLSLGNLKAQPSNVLKRRSLEPNTQLFSLNEVQKVKKTTRVNEDEVENKSPMRNRSRQAKDVKVKKELIAKGSPKSGIVEDRKRSPILKFRKDKTSSEEESMDTLSEDLVTGRKTRGNSSSNALPKRSTRSKAVKKTTGVKSVSTPKRTTRSRNKSENHQEEEETRKPSPTSKRSTRGSKKTSDSDNFSDDKSSIKTRSDGEEVTGKRGARRNNTLTKEADSSLVDESLPKTRGGRSKNSRNDDPETSTPLKATRGRKKVEKVSTAEDSKQSDETETQQLNRSVQTHSSDSDEPSEIDSLPKRSSRRKAVPTATSPQPKRTTRKRANKVDASKKDETMSEAKEVDKLSSEEAEIVPKTRRGRSKALSKTKVECEEEENSVTASPKQRRTRRAGNKSSSVSKTRDNSVVQDASPDVPPVTRRSRRKKEPSETPKVDKSVGSEAKKGGRKRNLEPSITENSEIESSPPKRGRRAKNQSTTSDKAVSPVKRVTRSRAKK